MRFVGIDPAAAKGIALVSVGRAPGLSVSYTSPVFERPDPQRLVSIRRWVNATVSKDAVCVLVEQQFNGRILPAVAAVCVEAAQAKAPGAVVLEMAPGSWRKALTGHGVMSKEAAMQIAEGWGVTGSDDLAEALCLALVAKQRWLEAAG